MIHRAALRRSKASPDGLHVHGLRGVSPQPPQPLFRFLIAQFAVDLIAHLVTFSTVQQVTSPRTVIGWTFSIISIQVAIKSIVALDRPRCPRFLIAMSTGVIMFC
jgi:hypothetical protein